MKHLYDELSFQCSRRVTNKYSTSFSWAVRMLSPKIRDAVHSVYGFVRLADEIVDSFHDFKKEDIFDEFENDLMLSLHRGISTNPILNAFQATVVKYEIDYDLIAAFMHSMRMDLSKKEYTSTAEYEEYIYGSADVVGLMCLKIFVGGDQVRYEELKPTAMKLGSAFQKVNFLRDLKDDIGWLNRSYFPHLKNSHLDVATKVMIIDEIEDDFAQAYEGIKRLPVEAKFGVYTAYIYYRQLLNKLKKINAEEIAMRRVRISNPMKFRLLAQSFINYKLNLI
jgi:phytoene synthase